MRWHLSHRADPRALPLANRHYTRQSPDSPQFVQPGRCVVLLTADADALWVTSWPYPELVFHGRGDAWVCTLFRNESGHLASELILEAISATRWRYGDPPPGGVLTFLNPGRVRPKRDYGRASQAASSRAGRCFLKAGFCDVGRTRRGLVVLQLEPSKVPTAVAPIGAQLSLEAVA